MTRLTTRGDVAHRGRGADARAGDPGRCHGARGRLWRPHAVGVLVKREGGGEVERDVVRARYGQNPPAAVEGATRAGGFTAGSVAYVATLHRYGARVPGAAQELRWAERALPEQRRSTI